MASKIGVFKTAGLQYGDYIHAPIEFNQADHEIVFEIPDAFITSHYDGANMDRPIKRYAIWRHMQYKPNRAGTDIAAWEEALESCELAAGETLTLLMPVPSFHHLIFSDIIVECGEKGDSAGTLTADFKILRMSDYSEVATVATDVDLLTASDNNMFYHPFTAASYTGNGDDSVWMALVIKSLPQTNDAGNMVLWDGCSPRVCFNVQLKTVVEDTCRDFRTYSEDGTCCPTEVACHPCDPDCPPAEAPADPDIVVTVPVGSEQAFADELEATVGVGSVVSVGVGEVTVVSTITQQQIDDALAAI